MQESALCGYFGVAKNQIQPMRKNSLDFRAGESYLEILLYRYVADLGCAFLCDNFEGEFGVGGVDGCRELCFRGEGVGLTHRVGS